MMVGLGQGLEDMVWPGTRSEGVENPGRSCDQRRRAEVRGAWIVVIHSYSLLTVNIR